MHIQPVRATIHIASRPHAMLVYRVYSVGVKTSLIKEFKKKAIELVPIVPYVPMNGSAERASRLI